MYGAPVTTMFSFITSFGFGSAPLLPVAQAASGVMPWMSTNSFLWSALTIGVFFLCRQVFLNAHKNSLLHPVLWATIIMVTVVELTSHGYAEYKAETEWLKWLLGPAVVSLAVPIFHLRNTIRAQAVPLAIVVITAVFFSMLSVYGMLTLFSLDPGIVKALSLKSITAPVAYRIAQDLPDVRAYADITGIGVMFAGIMGAVLGPMVLKYAGVTDARAVGLALGCTSHGVGTARALELGGTYGAFASMGMSCSAITAAIVCPLMLKYVL
ncbi:MAG: LrgB family protein [Candidatus Methylacidiphilales bacterium]|nr:LrgB family protein [Candidatus Methylacidiphilales bacterium]